MFYTTIMYKCIHHSFKIIFFEYDFEFLKSINIFRRYSPIYIYRPNIINVTNNYEDKKKCVINKANCINVSVY